MSIFHYDEKASVYVGTKKVRDKLIYSQGRTIKETKEALKSAIAFFIKYDKRKIYDRKMVH